jgi:hypothetical protein
VIPMGVPLQQAQAGGAGASVSVPSGFAPGLPMGAARPTAGLPAATTNTNSVALRLAQQRDAALELQVMAMTTQAHAQAALTDALQTQVTMLKAQLAAQTREHAAATPTAAVASALEASDAPGGAVSAEYFAGYRAGMADGCRIGGDTVRTALGGCNCVNCRGAARAVAGGSARAGGHTGAQPGAGAAVAAVPVGGQVGGSGTGAAAGAGAAAAAAASRPAAPGGAAAGGTAAATAGRGGGLRTGFLR